jgi:predicted 3-demethylubiquinone-9 3-methyltransferase (glyoxalase superfamily)
MQKITPYLWFDSEAEEAAEFYVGIFENSKILDVAYYGEAGPGPKGSVLTVTFQLDGEEFVALNGGPVFQFSEAVSFHISCETQEEVDRLWRRLTDGGEEGQCGWLKDRYGVSWQVVPTALMRMLGDPDPAKAQRVMRAMFEMKKIEIAPLEAAYAGR